jgi:transposase
VATIVKRAVEYGLRHRARPPVHVIGLDEVSRRKGQVYLTVVYDLERRVLLWVGDDRTEEAVKPFFIKEMGTRRCHTLRVVLRGELNGNIIQAVSGPIPSREV